MIYQFCDAKAQHYGSKLDPQLIGEKLESLRIAHDGKLEKKDVLIEASSPNSPLHGAFTWNDSLAAHRYRLKEAAQLIKALVAVDDETGEEVKAFWSVNIKQDDMTQVTNRPYYQSVRILQNSPTEYAASLKLALMELEGAEISLQQLKRIAPDKEHAKIDKAATYILDAHDLLYQSPSIGASV